nr:hypothetical protein [Tanacetum cinerariifolium]
MAISVISVSSDSSEDSVGTPAGRVILFGTIPTTIPDTTPVITPPTTQTDTTVIPTETPIIEPTIPPSPDYTPVPPDYSPASKTESDPSEDPSSGHIPPLPADSPFLSSDDDTTDTSRQPIHHGRPYRYHPNGPVHMMTARKRVGLLPVQQLAMRHYVDHFSSDSSSRHSLSDHSSPDLSSTSAGPSRKRRRSPMTYVPALPPVFSALSHVHAYLIPSPKRVRDIGYLAYVEVGPRETIVERVTHPAITPHVLGSLTMSISPVWRYDRLVSRAKVIENQVMVILVISVSSDSSEDSVGRPAGRGILFGTIPTTIPNTTPVIAPPTRPSRKRRRSPMTSVHALPHVSGALSPIRTDFIPSPKRDRDIGYLADVEVGPRETRAERVTHSAMPEDIPEPAQEGAVEVTYEALGDLV